MAVVIQNDVDVLKWGSNSEDGFCGGISELLRGEKGWVLIRCQ